MCTWKIRREKKRFHKTTIYQSHMFLHEFYSGPVIFGHFLVLICFSVFKCPLCVFSKKSPNYLHNVKLRGGIKKKNCFFLTFCQKIQTPPPPGPFLTASVFSDKDFLDLPRPPPLWSKSVKKVRVFSDKDFLDWPRPLP